MALRLIEGFDHFNSNALATAKGWTPKANTTLTFISGRVNGSAIRFPGRAAEDQYVRKSLASGLTDVTIGFAFQFSSFPNNYVLNLATAGLTKAVRVHISTTGAITVRNSSGTTIATASTLLVAGDWNYIELHAVINGASGSCELWLNGVQEITSTSGNFGSTAVQIVELMNDTNNNGLTQAYDDIYVLDTTGSANTSALGDVHVETIYPDGDGAHTDWTPNTGSDHYALVDDSASDGDSTYVSDATVNDIDTYTMGSLLALSGDIYGVQTNLWARKDDATVRQIAPVARLSGSDYVGSTATLTTSYVDHTDIQDESPDTSSQWTINEINAAEFGVKVIT